MSASRGKSENARLHKQIEEQLGRLLRQIEDCEELRDEMDDEEYEVTKQETLQQMTEFQATLQKFISGDMSLIDQFGAAQLALRAAISQAFKTPEVIALFAKKQPAALRQRLTTLERDTKLKGLPRDAFVQQAVEILTALKKLGEELSDSEKQFLSENQTRALADFETVDEKDEFADQRILASAGSAISRAQS